MLIIGSHHTLIWPYFCPGNSSISNYALCVRMTAQLIEMKQKWHCHTQTHTGFSCENTKLMKSQSEAEKKRNTNIRKEIKFGNEGNENSPFDRMPIELIVK